MRAVRFGLWGLIFPVMGLGLSLPGCSGRAPGCVETRTCAEPVGFIDAGSVDDWWDAGGAFDGPVTSGEPADPAEGGAAGESAGGASASDDQEAPSVRSVSPADGAVGIASDAHIFIAFSCPIAEGAFEAGYASQDLPAEALTFVWNAEHDSVTLVPKAPLSYQAGAALDDGALDFPAKTYRYAFGDLQCMGSGQPLSGRNYAFSTLRQVSSELAADPARTGNWTLGEGEGVHNCLRSAKAPYAPSVCIGDDASNVRYTGLVSFDLSPLSRQIVGFSSARLLAHATLYGSTAALGASLIEHVSFAELGPSTLTLPARANLGEFYGATELTSGAHFDLAAEVTSSVAQDYASPVGTGLSQYRLSFAQITADGAWDDIELPTNGIRLALTYLVP